MPTLLSMFSDISMLLLHRTLERSVLLSDNGTIRHWEQAS
jgi:hypothetical protein